MKHDCDTGDDETDRANKREQSIYHTSRMANAIARAPAGGGRFRKPASRGRRTPPTGGEGGRGVGGGAAPTLGGACGKDCKQATERTTASLPPIRAEWKRRAERAEAEGVVCTDPGACDGFGADGVWSEASGATRGAGASLRRVGVWW